MEHREPPRRAAAEYASEGGEGRDPLSTRRFRRFVAPPGVRRLALSRVALAALAGVGVLVLLAALGSFAARSLPEILNRQPVYHFAFRDIVLDPPPPPWYRGGSRAFLERLRAEAHEPGQQSVLKLDLERLGRVFRLDPWVRKVGRVERAYPNRVIVRLEYREPAAVVRFDRAHRVVLDEEGVVLSEKEIDLEASGPLIPLIGVNRPPVDPRPGETWKRVSVSGGAEADDLVVRAAGLAGYLRSVQDELERGPGETLVFSVSWDKSNRLWVLYGHRWFRWGEAPGREAIDELKAPAKWEILRDWLHESPPPPGRVLGYYELYQIGPQGIRFDRRLPAGG